MGEAGQRREWNGRGGHGAAEATRDGGDDLRYASPAWAGRRSLEAGGVMCRSLVRVPRVVGERPKWRGGGEGKVGVWESRAGQPPRSFLLTVSSSPRGSVDRVKSRFRP